MKNVSKVMAASLCVAAVAATAHGQAIVDSADTIGLWHMETITPNVTSGTFTSDAILDDDIANIGRDHEMLMGHLFSGFPANTKPTQTTGGGGVIGEGLSFDGNDESIAIGAWAGVTDSLDTFYIDMWFKEVSQDPALSQVLVTATSTWELVLQGTGDLTLNVWNTSFGVDTIQIEMPGLFNGGDLASNPWRHVTASLDSSGTIELLLTADGFTDRFATASVTGGLKPANKSITLGNKETKTRWFTGLMDEVYVGTAAPTFDTGLDGDLDGDGFVGINDLNIVLGAWNQNVPPADPAADPSGDGFVGIDDLNTVLGNWNAGTPPANGSAVPEPTSLALLSLGGVAILRRRA